MITEQEQIDQITELLGGMYRVLASLRETELPVNPGLYAIMAEGAVEQIRQFYRQLDEISGLSIAMERISDLWIRLEGPQLTWPSAPASTLANFLKSLQQAIYKVADSLVSHHQYGGGTRSRFAADLHHACALRVMTLQPGSIHIGISLPVLDN